MRPLITCLWFDTQAEEAARFYTGVFPDARMLEVTRYPAGSPGPEGSVMTASFTIGPTEFLALNGGPRFTFTEAVSFQIMCMTQEEVDGYWATLSEGGAEGPCGWLKDRFGVSWQVVPAVLPRLLGGDDPARAERVMRAMLGMGKLDIAGLESAAEPA